MGDLEEIRIETIARSLAGKKFREYGVNHDLLPNHRIVLQESENGRFAFLRALRSEKDGRGSE